MSEGAAQSAAMWETEGVPDGGRGDAERFHILPDAQLWAGSTNSLKLDLMDLKKKKAAAMFCWSLAGAWTADLLAMIGRWIDQSDLRHHKGHRNCSLDEDVLDGE